jgi:hypothetical protein
MIGTGKTSACRDFGIVRTWGAAVLRPYMAWAEWSAEEETVTARGSK